MKFLVDAQLPQWFVSWLQVRGHDAIHTTDLPLKNATPDRDLTAFAVLESRIVVTKDDDFVQSFMLTGQPALLLISIGNISNNDLERLLQVNLHLVSEAFRDHRFVEITHDGLITHE